MLRVHQQRNLTLPDLDYFTDLDVQLEPLALCLDETLLRDVLHFAEGAGLLEGLLEGVTEGSGQPHDWEWSLVAPVPTPARASKVVFDQLRISRISIDLSLRTARTGGVGQAMKAMGLESQGGAGQKLADLLVSMVAAVVLNVDQLQAHTHRLRTASCSLAACALLPNCYSLTATY